MEPRGFGVTLDRRFEHLHGVVRRAQAEQIVAPVEQVFLGRVEVRRALERLGRGGQVAGALLDITLEIAEHAFADGADVRGDQFGRKLPRLVQLSALEQLAGPVDRVGGLKSAVQKERRPLPRPRLLE